MIKLSGWKRGVRTGQLIKSAVLLAASLAVCQVAPAESLPPNVDPAFLAKLIQRLDAQDEKIKSQDAELKDLHAKVSTGTTPAPAPEMISALPPPSYPNLQFHGFGDIDYVAANRSANINAQTTGVNYNNPGGSAAGSYNSFLLGEFDLFLTSQLAENLSVLNETVIGAGSDNEWGLDIERLELQWRPKDWFNVDVGRFHTALGYYNTAFHHGTWFQTAVARPSFLEYEDSGGLLPVHTVGLSINGNIPSGKWNLAYFIEVGNGRAYTTHGNPVQNIIDGNGFKAVNFSLLAKPDWFPGGQFGAGIYHDIVTPDGLARTDELIPNAHIVYHNSAWELMLEGFLIRHKPLNESAHYSPMAYAQISRKFGLFTPYGRFTYVNASTQDMIYTSILNQGGLHCGPSLGLRYDVSSFVALKAQYDYMIDTNQKDGSALTLQAAFTF